MSPSLSGSSASFRRAKSASLTTPRVSRVRREGWVSPEGYFAPVFTAGGGTSGVDEGTSKEGSRVVSRRGSRDGRVGAFG